MSKIRKTLAAVLALVMCLSLSAPAFATEANVANGPVSAVTLSAADANDYGIMPLDTTTKSVGPFFTTVATSNTPIETVYYEVTGKDYNGWVYQINIKCLDQNGNLVKRFDNASGVFASNTLKLFQDHNLRNVYTIQMEIQPRLAITVTAYYTMKVTW